MTFICQLLYDPKALIIMWESYLRELLNNANFLIFSYLYIAKIMCKASIFSTHIAMVTELIVWYITLTY